MYQMSYRRWLKLKMPCVPDPKNHQIHQTLRDHPIYYSANFLFCLYKSRTPTKIMYSDFITVLTTKMLNPLTGNKILAAEVMQLYDYLHPDKTVSMRTLTTFIKKHYKKLADKNNISEEAITTAKCWNSELRTSSNYLVFNKELIAILSSLSSKKTAAAADSVPKSHAYTKVKNYLIAIHYMRKVQAVLCNQEYIIPNIKDTDVAMLAFLVHLASEFPHYKHRDDFSYILIDADGSIKLDRPCIQEMYDSFKAKSDFCMDLAIGNVSVAMAACEELLELSKLFSSNVLNFKHTSRHGHRVFQVDSEVLSVIAKHFNSNTELASSAESIIEDKSLSQESMIAKLKELSCTMINVGINKASATIKRNREILAAKAYDIAAEPSACMQGKTGIEKLRAEVCWKKHMKCDRTYPVHCTTIYSDFTNRPVADFVMDLPDRQIHAIGISEVIYKQRQDFIDAVVGFNANPAKRRRVS